MNKSFTLIEILVVIVVIGVLSAFILVGMSSITSSANIAKSQAFLNSIDNSLLLSRVSEWKLDDRPTIAPFTISDSWGTNTGTLMDVDGNCSTTKCPQLVTSGCTSGNCLSFDGIDDYVNLGTVTDIRNISFSISLWVKSGGYRNQGSQYNVILADGNTNGSFDTFAFFIRSDDSLYGGIEHCVGSTAHYAPSILNTWVHVVGVRNLGNSTLTMYVNSVAQTPVSSGTLEETSPFYIGRDTASTRYWTGKIDDVRVYNAAIPTSEIQQNYFIGLNNLLSSNGINGGEYVAKITELRNNISKGY